MCAILHHSFGYVTGQKHIMDGKFFAIYHKSDNVSSLVKKESTNMPNENGDSILTLLQRVSHSQIYSTFSTGMEKAFSTILNFSECIVRLIIEM